MPRRARVAAYVGPRRVARSGGRDEASERRDDGLTSYLAHDKRTDCRAQLDRAVACLAGRNVARSW
jgi:hypothetical protein